MNIYKGKVVFLTGSCGTIGSKLVEILLTKDIKKLICIDNNETAIFFQQQQYIGNTKCSFFLCDVRDALELNRLSADADIVFHTAALKHVPICEDSPMQAICTNVQGTQNVINACFENNIPYFLLTSSDKAVNPTNVMGASKLLCEKLVVAAAAHSNRLELRSKFIVTRFGNVLGSRGSVVPIFEKQIKEKKAITLTSYEMTRFIMSIEEAANLVVNSIVHGENGDTLITKMSVAKIADIAKVMHEKLSDGSPLNITEIGTKPGEKMYEELMNEEELRRSFDGTDYITIKPIFQLDSISKELKQCTNVYNSKIEKPLSDNAVLNYLVKSKILA